METRILQMTSGGSYLISLPKEWVKENGLSKGSQVGMIRLDQRTIMIDSAAMERPKPKQVEVKMSGDVGRELTASYLSGYDRVLVRSGSTITHAQKEAIRQSASHLAGMEVIDETSDSLLLANLVVPEDLSVEDVMRRMHQIGSSMLQDAIAALVGGDPSLAKNVIERDDALDRLYFLVIRLLRSAVRDLRVAERLGVLPAQCLDLRFAASMMEKIGDKSVSICASHLAMDPGVGMPDGAEKVGREMANLYEQATRALLEGDFKLANGVTRSHPRVAKLVSGLRSGSPPISQEVLDALEDVATHIFDIADVVTER
jgi:phosphate uptake regulator